MSGNGGALETQQPGRIGPLASGEVAGHIGPSRLRSIRIRFLLPVLLATAGLVSLGVLQSRTALDEASAGQRGRALARLTAASVALVHHVELEYSETNLLRQRGGSAGVQLVTAAQARVDAARVRFDAAAVAARADEPELGPAIDEAGSALNLLPAVRTLAPHSAEASSEVFDVYDKINHELVAVGDAVAAHLGNAQMVEFARSLVLVAEVEHYAAEQLDLLRRIFAREEVQPGELVQLAQWAGAVGQREEELERITGPAKARFAAVVAGPDVTKAAELRDAVLSSDGAPASLQTDPDVWYAAQSGLMRRLRLLEVELSTTMERRAYDIQAAAQRRAYATAGGTAAVIVVILTGAIVLAIRTSRRLRRVRDAALAVARTELPGAISRVTAARDAETVRGALQDSSSRVDAMLAPGHDEIGELTVAFGAVHRQAMRLAADQALLRMEVEATFVALSRRGQSLVQRQIHLIDEFGRAERDPNRLGRLFVLDHLAARMRRNEENLLVLAGGEPGRRFLTPVSVVDIVQAAAEETEDYERVEIATAPPVAVLAPSVGDLVHLLAELLENATSFSPPTTRVRVTARQTVEDLIITVYDEGIGMPPDKLAEANERLAHPSALTSTLVGTMGLLVVARLAQRHGITVTLNSTPAGGTAASVNVPGRVLTAAPSDEHLRRARIQGAPVAGIEQVPYEVTILPEHRPPGAYPAYPVAPTRAPVEYVPVDGPVVVAGHAQPVQYVDAATRYLPDDGLGYDGGGSGFGGGPMPVPGSFDRRNSTLAGFTAAGLPRRKATDAPPDWTGMSYGPLDQAPPTGGNALARQVAAGPWAGRPVTEPLPPGPPDPETARARLSSLASGIAAANRRPPPPPSP
jgi:signal transduction histidine kinase